MSEDYRDEIPFEDVVPLLDVKYDNGIAYMSVHTIDQMNDFLVTMVDEIHERGIAEFSNETMNALVWFMTVWQRLHDALDLEATKRSIPDTPEELFNEKTE